MPDSQAESTQYVKHGFTAKGNVRIEGSAIFGDQYNTYTSSSNLLQTQKLNRIKKEPPPSQLPAMLSLLKKPIADLRLFVLEAPSGWGEIYVAEHLARHLIDTAITSPESADHNKDENHTVLVPVNEINGRTLLSSLKDHQHGIVLVENASADRYETTILENLRDYCREQDHDLYIIFTTQDKHQKWDYFKPNQYSSEGFFELEELLPEHSPYSAKDLARWLCALLNASDSLDVREHLVKLGVLAGQVSFGGDSTASTPEVTETTLLIGLDQTVLEVAARLRAPQLIRSLSQRLHEIKNKNKLGELITEMIANRDRRAKDWFDHLETEEARYAVLALCLADNLPQETFWAIYEQLTKRAWRERHLDLRMTDYLGIQLQLQEYVEFDPPGNHADGYRESSPIRFINSRVREELIVHALNNYRRSLVQALPILADLVTEQNTTTDHSLVERLRELDIIGSELSPSEMNQHRRRQVRNRLIASIVEIQEREPQTAEHLLLTWAEGASGKEIDPYYQQALIDTLEAMYQTEKVAAQASHWYDRRRSFQLLHRWYFDYAQQSSILDLAQSFVLSPQNRQSTAYELDIEQRRARVRASMTRAIVSLLSTIDDDEWGGGEETQSLLEAVPKERPDDLTSLWHLLIALAWDPSSQVRAVLANALPLFLRGNHLHRFEALFFLLASDWNADVRLEIASLTESLCSQNSEFTYLLSALLDRDRPFTKHKLPNEHHYLRDEAYTDGLPEENLHLWTASAAMLMLALYDYDSYKSLFTTYLHTCVEKGGTLRFQAFEDILERILLTYNQRYDEQSDRALQNRQYKLRLERLFRHILLDATGDNFQSQPSKTLKMLIDKHGANGRRMDDILSTADQRKFDNFRSA